MDQLSPTHVPVYDSRDQQRQLWERCVDRGQPVVAVRDARRGFIVRYDLQHLDAELSDGALDSLRRQARAWRSYPTASPDADCPTAGGAPTAGADPLSEAEGVGGEAGRVSGSLHAGSEDRARKLASRLSAVVFDQSGWQ